MPSIAFDKLRLPVLAAPMFINSSIDLVVECAKAGIVAGFPSLNPREPEIFADWLDEIESRCAETPVSKGNYAVNLIVNKTNEMLESHRKIIVDKKVPLVFTSLGAVSDLVDDIHGYGGMVFHDVINRRHAEKAIEAGVDGLILVSAGAGGHGGTLNPLSFIAEIREMFDGIIALAGGISTGSGVAAARAAGADLAYLGTRFIATREASAEPEYQDMILRSHAKDVVYTNRVSGVHGNFLRESLEANKIDLDGEAPSFKPRALRDGDNAKDEKKKDAWVRIWSGGHGVGVIHEVTSVAEVVDELEREYHEAIRRLTDTPVKVPA